MSDVWIARSEEVQRVCEQNTRKALCLSKKRPDRVASHSNSWSISTEQRVFRFVAKNRLDLAESVTLKAGTKRL